ncbi:MAG TPA: alpha/beta fold hydrolase [Thermoanaerobaculia bacterium]|nr:alpha/beta fold hydrolase [Thermoanaerobaculia bacterium]
MKKIFLPCLFLLLLPLPSLSQGQPDLTAAATAFVNHLVKGEYEAAARPFTETMRGAAPPEKLGEIWKAIQTQMGAFQRIAGTRVEPMGGFQSVFVTSEFAGATVDLQVTFDSEGRIAGFFVRPTEAGKAQSPPEWAAPPYADKARFREEEVTVGPGEWALSGTLTLPVGEGPFPALVLVHGSGPHDRDETIGPNKPFKDLAWGLASRGIAVLRYEKRTKVYGLKLLALPGLTAKEEIVDDVIAAANLLRGRKEIDARRISVLGHSLGGTLVPRIGKADPGIAGFIVMAGAARPLEDLLLEQVPYIASVDGTVTEEEKRQIESVKALVETIRNLKQGSKETPMGVPASYWLDLRGYHPPAVAKELKTPFLILQGERDYQVTMEDFELWRKALADRKDVLFKAYPDLNHLFMEGKGKAAPEEYGRPGHVAQKVVEDVAGWILQKPWS